MFERDKMLFSFLLAYKELECEVKIDMRQVEFFIKGPLAQEDEIFKGEMEERVELGAEEIKMKKLKEFQELERLLDWF